jgi:hypothetical protein
LLHPGGIWHIVAKLERGDLSESVGPAYGSLDAAQAGQLIGAALSNDSTWWIEVDPGAGTSRNVFETWRGCLIWCSRIIAPFLAKYKLRAAPSNLRIVVKLDSFPSTGFYKDGIPSDTAIDAAIDVTVDKANRCASISFGLDWHKGFYRPDNYAEISLGTAFLEAVSSILDLNTDISDLRQIVEQAAGSSDFRHRHAFEARNAIERLAASGLTKEFSAIPISAGAIAKCGTAWLAHSRANGPRIEGEEACITFLKAFQAERLDSLIKEIRRFNRQHFVMAMLEGMQNALASERHWRTSARALRAIHGVDRDFEVSLKQIAKINGVMRANSILAELASAECLIDGGFSPGTMDIEELQARALQYFQTGDLIPAILARRMEPTIHISPTGDVLYSHDFEDVTLKYGAQIRHARDRETASEEYLERFAGDSPPIEPDQLFADAATAEYGLLAGLIRGLPYDLVDFCLADKSSTLVMPRNELIQRLNSLGHYKGHDASTAVNRLTLPSRASWTAYPEGTRPSDFDLARLDRRYSIIARPFIALSQENNPQVVIAPGIVERALIHNLSGAYTGNLQNEFWHTQEMRKFASESGRKIGLDFNAEVATAIESLGLRAWPSAAPSWCLNCKNTDDVKRLGDIDVLAISPDGSHVWVIEAKDLKMCRTLGESCRRLSDYQGILGKDGKPDQLLRHLNRVAFVRARASELRVRLRLTETPQVHGLVVVNSPQPMGQLAGEYNADSTVVMMDSLNQVPWNAGW